MFENCSAERLGFLYMPINEDYCLLGFDTTESGRKSPTFRENLLLPSSARKSELGRKTRVQI
jgi:hypothetical protein